MVKKHTFGEKTAHIPICFAELCDLRRTADLSTIIRISTISLCLGTDGVFVMASNLASHTKLQIVGTAFERRLIFGIRAWMSKLASVVQC